MKELEMIVGARKIGEAMGLSSRRIYELVDRGELPAVKLGGSLAIRKTKLLGFLEGLEVAAGASA